MSDPKYPTPDDVPAKQRGDGRTAEPRPGESSPRTHGEDEATDPGPDDITTRPERPLRPR